MTALDQTTIAAIEAEAAADLALLQQFAQANQAAFEGGVSGLNTLIGQLNDPARVATVSSIRDNLVQVNNGIQTMISQATQDTTNPGTDR